MRAGARTWIRTAALARMPERPVPGRPIGQLEVTAVLILAPPGSPNRSGRPSGPVPGDGGRAAGGHQRRLRPDEPAPRAEHPPQRGPADDEQAADDPRR